jgi:Na+/H+ antiporter NhaD/arsenite permease-like protein
VGAQDLVTVLPDPIGVVDRSRLTKPGIVMLMVVAGFLAGLPPALVGAFGAAMMLITRSREPRLVYDEVDWNLLVFFVGLFVIVGGAEMAGLTDCLPSLTNGIYIIPRSLPWSSLCSLISSVTFQL